MRVLITGIKGFVGPYLADSLQHAGIECVGISFAAPEFPHPISLDGITVRELDLRDRDATRSCVADLRPDSVVHLAAISSVPYSVKNPQLTFDVNVGGSVSLFDAVRHLDKPVRVLHVSSGNVYGNRDSGETGFREDEIPNPVSPYAASKLAAEIAARSFVGDLGMEIVIARPFNHTGPGQPQSFVCPEFARSIAEGLRRGENPVLLRTGALEPRRDFTDVRDVVEAYRLLLLRGRAGEVYNVSSGSLVSIAEIVALFQEAAGVAIRTETDPARLRIREVARLAGDSSKIRSELAWKPKISLPELLGDLLEYWKSI